MSEEHQKEKLQFLASQELGVDIDDVYTRAASYVERSTAKYLLQL
jgi:hypothetical protein